MPIFNADHKYYTPSFYLDEEKVIFTLLIRNIIKITIKEF
jgi:hypothetical protein